MELPFEVGQEVEVKFNQSGYRGAWFRCRIRAIKVSRGEPNCQLDYLDFPDEECTWTRPRGPDPSDRSLPWLRKRRMIWMIRPPAPPVLREDEIGEHPLAHMAVVFDNNYKVGDIVDWWKDDVFWTCHIAEVYSSSKKVKLVFPLPPKGEGEVVVGYMKDLRPACSWSLKHQWKVRQPKGSGGTETKCGLPRARLKDLSHIRRTIKSQLGCQGEGLDSLDDHSGSSPEEKQYVDKVQDQENYQEKDEQKPLEDSRASPGRREEDVSEVIRLEVSTANSDNSLASTADNTSSEDLSGKKKKKKKKKKLHNDLSGKVEHSKRAQKIGVCAVVSSRPHGSWAEDSPINSLSPDTDQEAPRKKGRRRNVQCTDSFCLSDSDQESERSHHQHLGPSQLADCPGVDSLSKEAIVNAQLAGKKSCGLDTEEENLLYRAQLETSKEPKDANSLADSTLADPEALRLTENDSLSKEAIVNGQLAGKKSCGLDTEEENLLHRTQLETLKEPKGANSQADSTLADPEALTLTENFSTSSLWRDLFNCKVGNELMTKKSGNVEFKDSSIEENSLSQSPLSGYGIQEKGKEPLKHELLSLRADGEGATVSEEKISDYHVSRCEPDEEGEKVLKDKPLRIECEVPCVSVLWKDKSPEACLSVLGKFEKGDVALEMLDVEVAGSTEGMQDEASVSSQSPGSGSHVCSFGMQQVEEPKSSSCQVEVTLVDAATAPLEMNSRTACISKEAEVVETLERRDQVEKDIPYSARCNKLLLRHRSYQTVRKATYDNFWRKRQRVISETVSLKWGQKRARNVMEPERNSKSCISSLDGDQVNPDDCVEDTIPSSAPPTPVRDRDSLSGGRPLQADKVVMLSGEEKEEEEKEEEKMKAGDCEIVVVLQVEHGKDEKAAAADQEHLRTVGGDEEVRETCQRAGAFVGTFDEAIPMEVDTVNLDGANDIESQLPTNTKEQQCKGDISVADVAERCFPDGCNWDEELDDLERLTERIYNLKAQLLGSRLEKRKKRQWVLVNRIKNTIRERDDPVMGFNSSQGLANKFSAGSAVTLEASQKTVCVNLAPDVGKHFMPGNLAEPVIEEQEVKGQKGLLDDILVKPQCLGERTLTDGGNFKNRARKNRGNTRVQLLREVEATAVQFPSAANAVSSVKFTQENPVQEAGSTTTRVHLISKSNHGLKTKQVMEKCTEMGSGEERFIGGTSMDVGVKYPCAVGKVSMRGALKPHPTYITVRKKQQSRSRRLAHERLKKDEKYRAIKFIDEGSKTGEQHGQKGREVASFSGLVLKEFKSRESKQSVLNVETCKTVAAGCSSPGYAAGSEIMKERNSGEELHPGIKLLPNRKWCVKAYADGKPVWVGEYPTMGAAIYIHEVVCGACPLNRTNEPTNSTPSRTPEEKLLPVSGSSAVENPTGIATNLRIYKGSVPDSTSTVPKLLPADILMDEIVVKMERGPVNAGLTNGSVTGEETESQVVAGVKEGSNERVDHLIRENKETVPELLSVQEEVIPAGRIEDMNVTNKDIRKFDSGLKVVSPRADVREKIQVGFREVNEGVLSPTASLRCHERLDINLSSSDDAAMVEPLKVRIVLDLVMGGLKTKKEQAAARQASLALWKAIYCCPQNSEEERQGHKTPDRLALLEKIYSDIEIDGSSQRVCLRSAPCGGNPGEEIYIGHYNTVTEADAACEAISRCKKVFKKSIVVEDVGSATVPVDCAPVGPALQADAQVVQVHNRDLPSVIQVPRPASETFGSHLSMSTSVVSARIVGSFSGQHQHADKIISELREGGIPMHRSTSGKATSRPSVTTQVHTSGRGLPSGLSGTKTVEASSSEKYPRRILEATHFASSVADKDTPRNTSLRNHLNYRGLLTTETSSDASVGVWRPCIPDGASHARSESEGTADGETSFQVCAHSAQFLQSLASNEACMQPVLAAGTHASNQYPTAISVATSSRTPLFQPLKCSSTQNIVDLEYDEEALTAGTANSLKATPVTSTKDVIILDSDEELVIDVTTGTANSLDVNPLTSIQDMVILDDDEEALIDITTGTPNSLVANPLTSNELASGASFRGPSASSKSGYARSHLVLRTNTSQAVRPRLQLPTTIFLKAPLSMADTSNPQVVDHESLDALAAQIQRRSQLTDSLDAQVLRKFQLQQEVVNVRENQERNFVSNPPHVVSDGDQQQQQALRVCSQFSGGLPLNSHGKAIGFPPSMRGHGGIAGGVNTTNVPESKLAAHFRKNNYKRRVYNCCMAQRTEAVEMDYVLIRALHCDNCNWLMHSDCAMKSKQLRLTEVVHENGQIHEHVVYTCSCKRTFTITLSMLARVMWMTQSISFHRNDKAFPLVLNYLKDILSRLKKVLATASSQILKDTHSIASNLLYDLSISPGAINYAAICRLLDSAVKLVAGLWVQLKDSGEGQDCLESLLCSFFNGHESQVPGS